MSVQVQNTPKLSAEPTDLDLTLIELDISLNEELNHCNTDLLEDDFKYHCKYSEGEARAAARQVSIEDERFY